MEVSESASDFKNPKEAAAARLEDKQETKNEILISRDLLIIKDLISRPRKTFEKSDDFKFQLQQMGYKVEKIEKALAEKRSRLDSQKFKDIIMALETGEKTSTDVGDILNMSRNRSNEYLRAMEQQGILASRFSGKKKYYKVTQKEKMEGSEKND